MWRGYYTKSDVMKQHANVPTCTCSGDISIILMKYLLVILKQSYTLCILQTTVSKFFSRRVCTTIKCDLVN